MGRFIVPLAVLAAGGGLAWLGYKAAKKAATPEQTGNGNGNGPSGIGQAILPSSTYQKNKTAEGILLSL